MCSIDQSSAKDRLARGFALGKIGCRDALHLCLCRVKHISAAADKCSATSILPKALLQRYLSRFNPSNDCLKLCNRYFVGQSSDIIAAVVSSC